MRPRAASMPPAAGLLLLAAAWCLAGCQVAVKAADAPPGAAAAMQPGSYAGDERWEAFAATWPRRVAGAIERLGVVTGLTFEQGEAPRTVLRPFGDERVPYELRVDIVDGRRRTAVHVNAEPLLAGVLDADRVLLRALATAAFEEAGRRHAPVPPWFAAMARMAAAGDLDARVGALYRRTRSGGRPVVDPDDPAAAEATGAAALLLLGERGQPQDVRRLFAFVADGDPAPDALARLVGEPGGDWWTPAKVALGARLAQEDDELWQRLEAAQEAAREAGRAGLKPLVAEGVPAGIEDEVTVLLASAAADEGAHAAARVLLATLSEGWARRVAEPAAVLALQVRVELQAGGDPQRARELARRLERDFPRSEARQALRRSHPLLGMQEDPQLWLADMRRRLAEEGSEAFELGTLERYGRTLLLDHRAGAAQAFLESIGARGTAPELQALREAVTDAQADPGEAALSRGAERVRDWVAEPNQEHALDVRESGQAAAPALLLLVARGEPARRAAAVELLARTVGDQPAVEAVSGLWRLDEARIQTDLEALASAVPYPALTAVRHAPLRGEAARALMRSAWDELTLGVSERWLRAHPGFLREIRHAQFAVRRDALQRMAAQAPEEATPALVALGLRDSAALLRREAVVLAGRAGFPALARHSLGDRAALVREEATRVVARLEGRAAAAALLRLLREDPSREVRAAAAQGLLAFAAQDETVMDALLATQVGEEARLRDAIATRLAELPAPPVVRALVRGWSRAVQREQPNRGYLFRTALLYQRVTQEDLGYYPGAARAELRGMLERMQAWLARREGAQPRRPAGRAR